MSLINRVLADLEKRGMGAEADMGAIRAVPAQNEWVKPLAMASAVLALSAAAAGVLLGAWHKTPAPENVTPVKIQPAVSPAPILSAVSSAQPASAALAKQEESAPVSLAGLELSLIPATVSPRDRPLENKTAQAQPPAHTARKKIAAKTAGHPASVAEAGSSVKEAPIKRVGPKQHAEDEFSQAMALIRAGRNEDALPYLENALRLNPLLVRARQALAALMVGEKRNADAERILQEGLERDIKQAGFAMLMARLQVERGDIPHALETLQKTLPYAEHQAEYHAFVAALMQRQGRHDEAIAHYQAALKLSPGTGVWLVGLGISLQAEKRNAEARDAFHHAIGTHTLSADLQDFVGRRLKEL